MIDYNSKIKEIAETQKLMFENDKIVSEINNDNEKTIIDKVDSLRRLLESITIDSENTVLASEPKLKNVLNESDVYKVKSKLFELIDKY